MRDLGHLRALVDEVRQHPVPELSHQRMRVRLMAELERTQRAVRAPRRSRQWLPVFALSGAALGGMLWLWTQPGTVPVAGDVATHGVTSSEWLDSSRFQAGERVAALAREVTVNHAAVAQWSLMPGSSARLLSLGDEVSIELEAGALSAAVVPRAAAALPSSVRSDFFVVRAFGTEVSVHGTRFRVIAPAAAAQPVSVEVDEGVVRVRPVGEGGGVDLGAGARAQFVAGKLVAGAPASAVTVVEPPPSARFEPAPPASVPAHAPSERPAPSAHERADLPPSPAPVATEASNTPAPSAEAPELPSASGTPNPAEVAGVMGIIRSCFHRYTRDRGDVRIQALSRLELDVLPNGRVLSLDLDPPLSPDIQQCADREVSALRLKPSETGYRIQETIKLSTE